MDNKLKPPPIRVIVKSCLIGYQAQFTLGGRQHKSPIVKHRHDAEVVQSRVNTMVREYKIGLVDLPPGVSLKDFIFTEAMKGLQDDSLPKPVPCEKPLSRMIESYLQISAPPIQAESSWKTERTHLGNLTKFMRTFGYDHILLAQITVEFFDRYKRFRYDKKIRTDTVNKELATFHLMFQKAVEYGHVKKNVVKDVRRDKSQIPCDRFRTNTEIMEMLQADNYSKEEIREIRRYRYLACEELRRLIALAEGRWLHPILVVFAHTGMRRGELSRLEWADVDLEKSFLVVSSKKQSRVRQVSSRRIYFNGELRSLLQNQKQKTGHARWVFSGSDGSQINTATLRETLRRLVKGTEFEGVGFHVMRHSLASNLASQGVDQRIIDKILGHQTESMRMRYQHLFPNKLEEIVQHLKFMQ